MSRQLLFTGTQQALKSIEEEKGDVVSNCASAASSSLLTMALLSQSPHNEKVPNELMQVCPIPAGPKDLILAYLGDDFDTQKDDKIEPFPIEVRKQLTFLGVNLYELKAKKAHHVAKLILSGEKEDVEEAVALVKNDASLLNYTVRVTATNGRTVEGRPLEIAAMAGDFNLKENLEEKDRGVVERLALAAELSKEETNRQLEVITSEEAKKANKARNKVILAAVKAFGEGIIKVRETSDERNSKKFQALCQPVIDQLEKALQADPKEVITLGYIFDIKISQDAAKWFKENIDRLGDWSSIQTKVFCINGLGKLQYHSSARDGQVIKAGIINFTYHGNIPARTLKNDDGSSDFDNSASRLGVDFYFEMYGGHHVIVPAHGLSRNTPWAWCDLFEELISSKNSSITKLTQHLDNPKRQSTCQIM
ncbi:MAG: hypothetical protein V4501_06870 [Pseudomonadota bacterium]